MHKIKNITKHSTLYDSQACVYCRDTLWHSARCGVYRQVAVLSPRPFPLALPLRSNRKKSTLITDTVGHRRSDGQLSTLT